MVIAPTFLDESDVKVPVKNDFSEVFERDKFNGKFVGKVQLHNLVTLLLKLQYCNVF